MQVDGMIQEICRDSAILHQHDPSLKLMATIIANGLLSNPSQHVVDYSTLAGTSFEIAEAIEAEANRRKADHA